MSRSNAGRNDDNRDFEDTLGQIVRWSLRSEASRQKLSPQVWPVVHSRVREIDRRSLQPTAMRRRARQVSCIADRGIGTLLHALVSIAGVCGQVWQYLDERTVSSEAVWLADTRTAPRTMQTLRYRLTVQVVCAGPMMGQRLPII